MNGQYKKPIIISIIVFLIISSFIYMITNKNSAYEFEATPISVQEIEKQEIPVIEETDNVEVVESASTLPIPVQRVPVYVCGEVYNPDVYYLNEGAILKEAIIAAGGFTDDANQNAWNLAMEIQRGLKIEVPKVGEEIDKITNSYDNSIEGSDTQNIYTTDTSFGTHQLININRATVSELKTLPGIGPVIAQNIIQYRENNGAFRSLQDIDNVPRIGQITLEKIKDYICFQ